MTKNKFSLPPEGSLHSIHIHDIAFPNNYGVGKIDGYVLFVPGALPRRQNQGRDYKQGQTIRIRQD